MISKYSYVTQLNAKSRVLVIVYSDVSDVRCSDFIQQLWQLFDIITYILNDIIACGFVLKYLKVIVEYGLRTRYNFVLSFIMFFNITTTNMTYYTSCLNIFIVDFEILYCASNIIII